MDFTYVIENYYPFEQRVYVVYTPDDPVFDKLGGWVYITPTMTPEQINAAVVAEAPIAKWNMVKSDSVLGLIGMTGSGTKVAPTPEEVATYAGPDGEFLTQMATGSLTAADIVNYMNTVRARQRELINGWRQGANFTSFTYLGKEIACDALSRSDIDGTNGYITSRNQMPTGWPGGWKAKDNTYVPISTIADWQAFYEAMYVQGLLNFAKSQALKTLVANAQSLEAIRAINWQTPTP